MDMDTLNNFGVIVAIIISVAGLIINSSRARHQNNSDDGSYVKDMVAVADITTRARLDAEQRANKLETRITDLEKQLSGMAYRVTLVVHTGEDPRIEKISVERFSDRRAEDTISSLDRRAPSDTDRRVSNIGDE